MKKVKILRKLIPFSLAVSLLIQPGYASRLLNGTTERLSIASSGEEGNDNSEDAVTSGDGRYVAFSSVATNLVPGDTNAYWDIFVRDRQGGTTRRVSISSSGGQSNGTSDNPAISTDGRYVAFTSIANNLVTGDSNGDWDVFVHDLQTNQTRLVSYANNGEQGVGGSNQPSLSANGRYIAFDSGANNLVSGDSDSVDVFVRDMVANTITLISISYDQTRNGGRDSGKPAISDDGKMIAFESSSSILVQGDTNGFSDIFVRNLTNNTTQRVSVTSTGGQSNGNSYNPEISADGRYVAFTTIANNLVAGDNNGDWDVFVHDLDTGETRLVSVAPNGTQGIGGSNYPSLSADGRYIAFDSGANNLVSGDSGYVDVFLRDMVDSTLSRLSVSSNGTGGNADSGAPGISSNGQIITFYSFANNLISGDNNQSKDLFARLLQPPPLAQFTADKTSGSAPLMVLFTDQSTGVISSWTWDFGDGGTSSQQNPTHTFQSPGIYTVSLLVNNAGGSDTEIKTNYVEILPSEIPLVHLPLLMKNQCEGLWEVEPNNNSAQANGPLKSGVVNCGYPDDKNDLFFVDLPAAGKLSIVLSNNTGQGVQLQLYYETTEKEFVGRASDPPYQIIDYPGQAGRYYIFIYTESGHNTKIPYALQVIYP